MSLNNFPVGYRTQKPSTQADATKQAKAPMRV